MARWSEYFQKLPNVPGDVDPEVLENIQKRSVNTALDEKPTMDEMDRAIKRQSDGKAPGGDGIPAEVWTYGGANLSNRLHQWIIKIWEDGHVPQARKDTNIVTKWSNGQMVYKKGDRTECGNYRGISLLSAAGKIFVGYYWIDSQATLPQRWCQRRSAAFVQTEEQYTWSSAYNYSRKSA